MSEPIIYVIPPAYYGGAVPKALRQIAQPAQSGGIVPVTTDQQRKISPKILFWGIVGVLFVVVLVVATWYFTRDLRRESEQLAGLVPPAEQVQQNSPPGSAELPAVPSAPPEEGTDTLPEIPVVVPPLTPNLSEDVDNDGLTTAEEDLYATQATRPDTDSDGFLDGHETLHLYNPAGVAPERLEETATVRRFKNESLGYSLLLPTAWKIVADLENPDTITIQTAMSETVLSISTTENIEQRPLAEWYQSRNFSDTVNAWTTNKAGLNGIISQDQLRAYFGSGRVVYQIEHKEIGSKPVYNRTFEMMLNSFVVSK